MENLSVYGGSIVEVYIGDGKVTECIVDLMLTTVALDGVASVRESM